MASQLYTIEPYSPTINPSILPNISTLRAFSRPCVHPSALLYTTTPTANALSSTPASTSASTSTPNSSSNRTGKPHKISRPPNSFFLFRSAFLKESRIPAHAETRQQHLSKVIGQCWNMMSPDERAVWDAKAEEAKQVHAAQHPGYKFQPASRKARATGARKASAAAKARDEKAETEKDEATRKLREEFTPYKGEPGLSKRNSKKLARSVRGTERAARAPRKTAASATASSSTSTCGSTSTPAPAAIATSSSTTSNTAATACPSPSLLSALLSPLPLRVTSIQLAPFLPSSTRLAPATPAGPQITRIMQSPPLTPFYPSDRQPQLEFQQVQQLQIEIQNHEQIQLPQLGYMPPGSSSFGVGTGMEDKCDAFDPFGGLNVSVSQGVIYPAMGMGGNMGGDYASLNASNAFSYFNGTQGGQAQVADLDHPALHMNTTMHQYLGFEDAGVDYSAFTANYTGNGNYYCDAPAPTFSPAVSSPATPGSLVYPISPISNGSAASLAYPNSPITPASASGSLDSPITLDYPFPSPDPGYTGELTLTAPYPDHDHNHDHDHNNYPGGLLKFDENDNQLLSQTEFLDALQRRYSSSASEAGSDLSMGVGLNGAQDEAALNRGDHGAYYPWSQQFGASVTGLEVEFGKMEYF
ncbi:hypothetical protein D9619_000328 [Psilocybe cf. subviscida]|uniref:HMG box domain-containing protein n=1 Tax=Psilocybe cf. subviscida TaxID=2480587 RepID=A0A8H5BFP3_9AGAR|nr:hypothetical protein D9619_000328 [Psilocybe cf. subviscida]